MSVGLCAVDHDELSPRPSVPFSHYKRRPPPLVFFTPVHSPPLTDHTHSLPEQGEHQVARISPEFAAAQEERHRQLEPPQEKLPVPGGSPSSTSSFAPVADHRLSPGEPPTTPTIRVRVQSRWRCSMWTMNRSRSIRVRSCGLDHPVPLCHSLS